MRVVSERHRALGMLATCTLASVFWALALTIAGRWDTVTNPLRDAVIIAAVALVVGGGCAERVRAAADSRAELPDGSYGVRAPARWAVVLWALGLAAASVVTGFVIPAVLVGVVAYDVVVRRAEDTKGVRLWRQAGWRPSFGATPPKLYCARSVPVRDDERSISSRVLGHQT